MHRESHRGDRELLLGTEITGPSGYQTKYKSFAFAKENGKQGRESQCY